MEILIVLGSIAAGIIISRMYRKYRGPIFDLKSSEKDKKEKHNGIRYKDLRKQTMPPDTSVLFMPPLSTVIEDAEAENGRALNENQFNAAKNNAYAKIIDTQEAIDWQELNNGRANNFSFEDWVRWRDEDKAA